MSDKDFIVRNEGTIFLLTPLSRQAREWVMENLPEDAMWWGGSVVIEHRYIGDIRIGIALAGLTFEPE